MNEVNEAAESNSGDVPDQPEEVPDENIGCDDSDGGRIPDVFGTASDTNYDIRRNLQHGSLADKCVDAQILNESLCQNTYISSVLIDCDVSCQNGICVAPSEPLDLDGGEPRPNPLAM